MSQNLTLLQSFHNNRVESTFSNSHFLPIGTLHRLLTDNEIENQMRRAGLRCPNGLVKFVSNHAKRVFAILVYARLLKYASTLFEYKFENKHLPILCTHVGVRSVNLLADHKALGWFAAWDDPDDVYRFEQNQWFFLAPEFAENSLMEQPHDECPLPVITSGYVSAFDAGSFNILHKGKLLEDHIGWFEKVSYLSLTHTQDQDVAIKELVDTEKVYEIEADALGLTRKLNHPHLIKIIAGFQQRQKNYLIFQWENGGDRRGDLNTFWKKNEPLRSNEYFQWALKQFHGLACGLQELQKRNCCHTDLKPSNILSIENDESYGHFQIVDLGLAKIHVPPTSLRRVTTTNIAGAGRYQPPEGMETWKNGTQSSWSMGCILLELIVWLLHGSRGWKMFNRSFEGPFFSFEGSDMIDPGVKKWIRHLKTTCLSATTCVSPALKKLLDYVCSDLLVRDVRSRGQIGGDINLLPNHTDESIPTILVNRQTFNIRKKTEKSRATIDRLCSALGQIASSQPDYLLNESVLENFRKIELPTIHRPPNTAHFGAGRQIQIADSQLSDKWDTINDNVFSRELFPFLTSNLVSGVLPNTTSSPSGTSGLCKRCAGSIFSDFSINRDEAIEESKNCQLCKILSEQDWGDHSAESSDESAKIVRSDSSLKLTLKGSTKTIFSIVIAPGPSNAPMHIQRGFPCLPHPGSEIQTQLFNHWITDCYNLKRHECGKLPTGLQAPKRLIHVGDLKSRSFTIKLDCSPDKRKGSKYTILSHPWGDKSKHPRYCMTIKNCDDFKMDIKFDELPKNFQDAVTVTRNLNIQYLWIDSLCIMQRYESDDKSECDDGDFASECEYMEDYYSGAYCTIAATSASGLSDGFLNPQHPDGSSTRQRHCFGLNTGIGCEPKSDSNFYLCSPIDNFSDDVEKSYMSSRGWVFQERALSRRTIHFSKTQVYFECGEGIRCETMTKLFNRKSSFLSDPSFPKAAKQYKQGMQIEFFQEIFTRYSTLEFDSDHEGDRAWALKGLEKRLSREYKVPVGHGVLGRQFLCRSLLWRRAANDLNAICFEKGKSPPSWSWMGLKGRIAYLDAPYSQAVWNTREIDSPLSFKPDPKNENAEITVIGELRAVARNLSKNVASSKLILDWESKVLNIKNFKCVIVGSGQKNLAEPNQKYYVLLVVAIDKTEDCSDYERKGVAVLSTNDIIDLDKSNMEKVRII
ncbi:hypothetical protein EV127DRAFT_331665 [Xylaria flabelliformis]|nr:hypothetical protein EV127DRAFT_331665 [Xylaria flabelliformis]